MMCLIALLAMTLVGQAGYISGSVNFSSAYSGGVVLQDSAGNVTTNLADAAGIKEWNISEVEEVSGSFDAVTDGASVSFLQPWLFEPLAPAAPLWKIDGPENFTFHLTSTTMMYQSPYFLAVRGDGFLSGDGYEDTPAEWWFTTQGSAVDHKFTWSSTAVSVPDAGSTVILLGGSLLGLFGVRRWFKRGAHAASPAV